KVSGRLENVSNKKYHFSLVFDPHTLTRKPNGHQGLKGFSFSPCIHLSILDNFFLPLLTGFHKGCIISSVKLSEKYRSRHPGYCKLFKGGEYEKSKPVLENNSFRGDRFGISRRRFCAVTTARWNPEPDVNQEIRRPIAHSGDDVPGRGP